MVIQVVCVFITATAIVLAIVKPKFFVQYFYVFFTIVVSVHLGMNFWNLAIFAVDKILIDSLNVEKYQEVFEVMRRLMFPSGISMFLFTFQLIPLVIFYKKAKNAPNSV